MGNSGGGKIVEIFSFFFLWGAAAIVWKGNLAIPYWLAALKMFPYFMAGHYCRQYCVLSKGILNKQWVQTSAIILFIGAMIFTIRTNFHFISLTGMFAIIVLLNLFASHADKLPRWLSSIGRYSLEIYVLHWFFLPQMKDWGKYFLENDSFNGNMILIMVVCSAVSAFIITACLIAAKIIKQSEILDYLCFGVKTKK